ncbi:MAG: DUF4440 domain-containing protein [Candidatus Palauibacterales bacterium]|nr:DUF4440 domain-containing protein [Candidatus Palauibacterales bacterium]MDP2530380.1 DUF4440 domain-containing protein [Candidatus Palauibacterales bacterium]MDP2585066.1 DUF4440 domain-containing protein [Candidatus Palauibacterales bacterium]
MRTRLALALLAAATATQLACAPTDQRTGSSQSAMASPAPTAADTAAVEHGIAAFDSAMNAGDVDALAALYTADAVSIPPDVPAVTGTEAIKTLWTDFLAQGDVRTHNVAQRLYISGDLATGWGTYTVDVKPTQGSPVHVTGNFAVIWRKQADGSWKAVMNIWNRDAPAPSM